MAMTEKQARALAQEGQSVKRGGRGTGFSWYVTGTPYTELEATSAANIAAAAGQAGPTPASQGGTGTPASDIGGGTVPTGTNGTTGTTGTEAPTPTPTPAGSMGEAARKAVQEAGLVYGMESPAPTVPGGLDPKLRTVGEEAVKAHEARKPVIAAEARKSQAALGQVTEATIEYQAAIDKNVARVSNARASVLGDFESAIGKAETYAGEARERTVRGLQMIDDIATSIYEKMDVGKAWDMEVAVQSTVEGMSDMERQTLQQYGPDSDEYRQFQAGKGKTLAGVLTNIQGLYARLGVETANAMAKTKADYLTQADMYESFQQQQDVEISAAMSNAKAAFELQASEFIAQQEMLKMTGWENLANWQVASPTGSSDSMEVVNFLGQLAMGEWQANQAASAAEEAAAAQKSAGTKSMIGSIGGLAAAALIMCDKRIKENPTPIPNALDKVGHLEGYVYSFSFNPNGKEAGIMAQDLERVLPEGVLVKGDGIKFVKMDAVLGLLVNALNELTDKVAKLEDKING